MSKSDRIYLDAAAATPLGSKVLAAMLPYLEGQFYNPSALYEEARSVSRALEDARSRVARCIGAKPSEVIFTSGGTESANIAIYGTMEKHNGNIVVSAVEHEAVRRPAARYACRTLPVDENGVIQLDELSSIVDDETTLVSVMLVNNEVGALQPIAELVKRVESIRRSRKETKNTRPLYVHVDACQAPLYLDTNVKKLGVDLLTLNGGKMHGPKQSGVLYVGAGVELTPLIVGGGQEFGLRSGTESVALAVGFAAALERADQGRAERAKRVTGVRDYFIEKLEGIGAELNGPRSHRAAHNIHVTFPGADNERMLFALDDYGVAAAAGSACSAGKDTSSHVLLAMGRTDKQARSSIRFSLLQTTSIEDIDNALVHISRAIDA